MLITEAVCNFISFLHQSWQQIKAIIISQSNRNAFTEDMQSV